MPPSRTSVALAVLLQAALPSNAASGPAPILRADGIGPVAAPVRFGALRAAALRRLQSLLGRPVAQRTIADCGQGQPMGEIIYRGHLVVALLHGRFSGWTLDGGTAFRTDRGVGIGSARGAVMKAYPGSSIDEGSLGVMFTSEHGVSGFLDADRADAHVVGLYAGETCKVS